MSCSGLAERLKLADSRLTPPAVADPKRLAATPVRSRVTETEADEPMLPDSRCQYTEGMPTGRFLKRRCTQ